METRKRKVKKEGKGTKNWFEKIERKIHRKSERIITKGKDRLGEIGYNINNSRKKQPYRDGGRREVEKNGRNLKKVFEENKKNR